MRIGSLFSGYGGLDMGVQAAIGGTTAWVSDVDPGACKILANRWPDVPNLGDITAVDWAQVEPVDVLTGGFPCQDLSLAGKGAGLKPGTRSGLWSHMAYAVSILRPRLVVAENVRGILSATADSDVECCTWCVGGPGDGEPALRALGAVLGDLADLGYDARWVGLRASDVGAPHARFRVFIAATDTHRGREQRRDIGGTGGGTEPVEPGRVSPAAEDTDVSASDQWRVAAPRQAEGGRARSDARRRGRAPVADAARDGWDEGWTEPAGIVGGPDAPVGCPSAAPDTDGGGLERIGRVDPVWGDYGPAVRRWGRRLGRPAPSPTEPGRTGDRLSPRFAEWMMGLADGHVTDVPGLTRSDQLKALGNGVVPQQAEAAIRDAIGGAW